VTNFGLSQRQFEKAELLFDISADLTKLIHVNTHLSYSYIIAEWGNTSTDLHSSILWNYFIQREGLITSRRGCPIDIDFEWARNNQYAIVQRI
jgi:hypothetical protein